jgi:hypothetical protein
MGVGALVLWSFHSEADAIGRESNDRKSVEKLRMQWLSKTLLKCAAKASATSHGWLKRFPSISSSMGFLSFFAEKIHRICLEIIIDTFKPIQFIALHGCCEKPTI